MTGHAHFITKDLVNGSVGGQCAVEDRELPLEPRGDVVPAAARVNHGCKELDVDYGCKVTRFLQAIHAFHFHHLPHNLIGHLVTPFIDDGHVDIVHKHRHLLASWRAIRATNTLFNVALNCSLKWNNKYKTSTQAHSTDTSMYTCYTREHLYAVVCALF